MVKKSVSAVLVFLGTLAAVAGVNAQQSRQQPLAPAKPAELKSLIVETVHPYMVRAYNPPLPVATTVTKAAMAFDHPERTLAAYFSAMVRGSYTDFLACWTVDSVAQLEQANKKMRRSPEQWERIWATSLAGQRVMAMYWINYGRYVLVNYRVEPSAGLAPTSEAQEAVAVLIEESPGVWKLTQALRADAVPQHWKANGNRIRLPADSLFDR
jgi:hypothetical protein